MLIGLAQRLECENEKLGWRLCSWTALSWELAWGNQTTPSYCSHKNNGEMSHEAMWPVGAI
jgi:hypothetical protein